jgi:hypothetical protein
LIDSNAKGIKTKGCKLQKDKWALMLLSKEPFVETVKFNKSCDLQGQFTVKMNTYFPVNLKVRNFKQFNAINSDVKISVSFTDSDTLLRLDLKKSKLVGNKALDFNLDYTVAIDPFSKPIIKKHIGGKLFVSKFGGQKFYKSYPLKFK